MFPAQSHRRTGFTLIELMIVIVIIMVLVTMAMPDVMRTTRNQPIARATERVMNMVHFAKNRAVNDFSAYGLQIVPYISDDLVGQVNVFKGSGPQCGSIDIAAGAPVKAFDLDSVLPVAEQHGGNTHVRILTIKPDALNTLCFTPDGRMLNQTTSKPLPSDLSAEYGSGDAVIVLQRFTNGVADSLKHNVIVPFSGKPRYTHGDHDAAAGEGGA